MDEPETVDDWQDEAVDLFECIWEDYGLGSAVSVFLAVLGSNAVETNTLGSLIEAMNHTITIALERLADEAPHQTLQ